MEYLELLLVKPQAFPKSVSNREDLPMETKLISIPLDQVLGTNLIGNSGWRLERAGIINKADKHMPITNTNLVNTMGR